MTIYILFSTDAWNTNASKEIISVNKRFEPAITAAKRHADADEEPLSDTDIENLRAINQTQGRDLNYLIELHDLND
jgi:hypothetical protein